MNQLALDPTLAPPSRYSGKIRTKYAEAANQLASTPISAPTMVEFVGASDATIAEAVRNALADASQSLRTLDGAGVLVIPQILRDGGVPHYRVTLQVTAASSDVATTSGPPPAR